MINLVERTMTQMMLEYEDFTVEAGIPTHEEIIGYTFYGEGIVTYYDNDDNIIDEKDTEIWGTIDDDGDFILDRDCVRKIRGGE